MNKFEAIMTLPHLSFISIVSFSFQSIIDVPYYRHPCLHRRCLRVCPCGPRCHSIICPSDELRGIVIFDILILLHPSCRHSLHFLHSFHVQYFDGYFPYNFLFFYFLVVLTNLIIIALPCFASG